MRPAVDVEDVPGDEPRIIRRGVRDPMTTLGTRIAFPIGTE